MNLNLAVTSSVFSYTTSVHVRNVTHNSLKNVAFERIFWAKWILGISFGFTIFAACAGNLIVCTSVFTNRRLRMHKTNYFIVSLAVADLLVSVLVMPFAMTNVIQQKWIFGKIFCRIWIFTDVMCSTASIFNLCVISFDRYKHIKNAMYYNMWMTRTKALTLIAAAWIAAALISFLPIHMGWYQGAGNSNNECIIKFYFIYALGSSIICFYIPCAVMLALYFRLYLCARSHAICIKSQNVLPANISGVSIYNIRYDYSKNSLKTSDHKAAITLGIITGVFLCCWLPFYIIHPINSYDPDLVPDDVFALFVWLGYVNSCLNPIIYSAFNKDFRVAFKRIICLRICFKEEIFFSSQVSSTSIRTKF